MKRVTAECRLDDMASELQTLYPGYMAALGIEIRDMEKFCVIIYECAKSYALSGRRDVFKLIVLSFSLGAYFPHDLRFQKIVAMSLGCDHIPTDQKVTALSDFTEHLLQTVRRSVSLSEYGLRLTRSLDARAENLHSETGRATRIFDLHPAAFSDRPELCALFCRQSEEECDRYDIQDPVLRFAYTGCAAAHGVRWFENPLFKNLKSILSEAETLSGLRRDLEAFYRGFA